MLTAITLVACGSNKPSEKDLEKSFNSSFDNFKEVGLDLGQYVTADGFKVTNSYENGNFYIVKAIPKIKITKSLDSNAIQGIQSQLGLNAPHVIQMIKMLEVMESYDKGDINKQQMRAELSVMPLPKGTLMAGDTFSGLESEYKFRKTDNGWMAVN